MLPFGSIVTGLGTRSSDFDVYVRIPYPPRIDPVDVAAKLLRNTPWIFRKVFAIPQAKVPIIKFNHIPTGCNCDINFKGLNGVRNSKLIHHLFKANPRALKLAIIVKYWAKLYYLTGTNLLANYALTMLVIFYLQSIEMLAPVVEMQKTPEPFMVDNWNTAFDKYTQQPNKNEDDLYHLLGGFFKFYREFRFDINVVSTYLGVPVPRSLFIGPVENLPEEYSLYKENLRFNNFKPLRVNTLMCVQDPFEHNRNCTVALSPKLVHKIMLYIRLAANLYDQMGPDEFLKAVLTITPPILPKQQYQLTKTQAHHTNRPAANKKRRKYKNKTHNLAQRFVEITKGIYHKK